MTDSSTASSSSAGATVTVCAVFQFIGVNVSARVSGVASVSIVAAASSLVAVTTTLPVGWPPRRTV